METFNTLLLIATAITSILNLLVEIEDTNTIKYEAYLKICFGSIAIICLIAIGKDLPIVCYLLSLYVLLKLSLRLHNRLKVF